MRVAHALAETERAAVDPIGAGDGRLDRIDDAEAAVAVAVPVEGDLGFDLVQHAADVADHSARAFRRRVAHGIADRDTRRAFLDRGAEKSAKRVGLRPGRVLRDVEHGQLILSSEAHGLAGVVDHLLDRPALGVLANRAGSDKRSHLNGDADSLRDLDPRPDVALERTCGAHAIDPQPPVETLVSTAYTVTNV